MDDDATAKVAQTLTPTLRTGGETMLAAAGPWLVPASAGSKAVPAVIP